MGHIRLVTESKTRAGGGGGGGTYYVRYHRAPLSASVCNGSVTVSRGDCYQDNAEDEASK